MKHLRRDKHKLGVDSKQMNDPDLLAKRSIEDTVFPKPFSQSCCAAKDSTKANIFPKDIRASTTN